MSSQVPPSSAANRNTHSHSHRAENSWVKQNGHTPVLLHIANMPQRPLTVGFALCANLLIQKRLLRGFSNKGCAAQGWLLLLHNDISIFQEVDSMLSSVVSLFLHRRNNGQCDKCWISKCCNHFFFLLVQATFKVPKKWAKRKFDTPQRRVLLIMLQTLN